MKHIYSFLLGGVIFPLTSIADDLISVDGKEWAVETIGTYPGALMTKHRMWIEGDTVVNDKTCKKLHILSLREDGEETYTVEYCRQEGKKFYRNESLMFDFGLQEGDLFSIEDVRNYTVTHVGDTILADGVTRRCLTINPVTLGNSVIKGTKDFWVEGIGSLRMGIYDNDFYVAGMAKELMQCTYNNVIVYEKERSDAIESEYTETDNLRIRIDGCVLACTSPTATLLEIYTLDAVKVGQSSFHNGEASVTVDEVPATYLYIVTYPDGRRENGKLLTGK